MSEDVLHPDVVLESLISKGGRKDKLEKLRKLHELCRIEHGRPIPGSRDLSLGNMARIAESHGLFVARTVYNAQSRDYSTLIQSWEAFGGGAARGRPKSKPIMSDKYDFLAKIDDPAVRNLCLMAFAERDRIKTELNLLKSKTNIVVDMRPLRADFAKGANGFTIIEATAQLTESERTALMTAIDPKVLAQRKWNIGEAGEVVDDHNRFVFKPGFATAIQKILTRGR